MPFDAILNKIRKAKAELIANREADALKIAFDQLALVKLRIQAKGLNAENAPFPPYTPAYAKQRQKAGYQVGIVDFTRTGRMWANVSPKIVSSTVFAATVEISGDLQLTKDILAGARPKRGNILKPTAQELKIVRDANKARVEKYLRIILQ